MTASTPTMTPPAEAAGLLELASRHRGDDPDWLRDLRAEGAQRVAMLGLPHKKQEEWRYTDPAPLTETAFVLPGEPPAVQADTVARFAIADLTCSTLVFVNGGYRQDLSELQPLPKGVQVMGLNEAVEHHRPRLEPMLNVPGEASSEPFTRLNQALWGEGVFVHVPAGVTVPHPIRVLNLTVGLEQPTLICPRNLILADENARVTILEQYEGLTEGPYLNNAVTQIDAGREARVGHYLIERENPEAMQVSTLLTEQGERSRVDSHTALFGGRLIRNNVNPRLHGEEAHCLVNGTYVGADHQHMDNHMRVEHLASGGDSRQFYKGVLSDHAHAVFSGRIYVAEGAQKTDAKQTNANLLLSDTAQATTKPQLEIYADDVKCTHGALSGHVDEQAVFYLQARGVPEPIARAMMIYAYAAEGLQRMAVEPVRRWLSHELLERLPHSETLKSVIE